jgi:hypothetical protein
MSSAMSWKAVAVFLVPAAIVILFAALWLEVEVEPLTLWSRTIRKLRYAGIDACV